MSKIAVIFPGMGYTKDRPLLYYAGKIAVSCGYELRFVDFSGIPWSKEDLKDHKKFTGILEICLNRAKAVLSEIDVQAAESLLFISKSIGTVAASACANKMSLEVKQIYFTPLEAFAGFLEKGNGLVFYGKSDPFANEKMIAQICSENKLESHGVDAANHSLETKDLIADIDNLRQIMLRVEDMLAN